MSIILRSDKRTVLLSSGFPLLLILHFVVRLCIPEPMLYHQQQPAVLPERTVTNETPDNAAASLEVYRALGQAKQHELVQPVVFEP